MSKQAYLYSIDNGNSNPHIAKIKGNKIIQINHLKDFDLLEITKKDQVIISCVAKKIQLPEYINILKIPKFDKGFFLDMPVKYENSLGEDRLYQSYFLFHEKKPKTLLIDAGTFTTFDFITKSGLEGGLIFPGVQTFLNSYQKGENLPIVEIQKESHNLKFDLAHDTHGAISNASDIYNLGLLKRIIQDTRPESIMLTGGFSNYFKSLLDQIGFSQNVKIDKHLIHTSLSYIATKLKT